MKKLLLCLSLTALFCVSSTQAAEVVVKMNKLNLDGSSVAIGDIKFIDTAYGLLVEPMLTGLPAGPHGFHVHQNASCDDYGMSAGGHFDPQHTDKHQGPFDASGHQGDLPLLVVDNEGATSTPLLAPKLTVAGLKGHAIMIHAGGDNYSDQPQKLGGGGARIACGVVS